MNMIMKRFYIIEKDLVNKVVEDYNILVDDIIFKIHSREFNLNKKLYSILDEYISENKGVPTCFFKYLLTDLEGQEQILYNFKSSLVMDVFDVKNLEYSDYEPESVHLIITSSMFTHCFLKNI